jgi:hypothetical protein
MKRQFGWIPNCHQKKNIIAKKRRKIPLIPKIVIFNSSQFKKKLEK